MKHDRRGIVPVLGAQPFGGVRFAAHLDLEAATVLVEELRPAVAGDGVLVAAPVDNSHYPAES